MKTFFILIGLVLICSSAFAGTETYAVQQPDGSVAIVNYIPGSSKTIEQDLQSKGYENLPVYKLRNEDMPPSRVDRKYWKIHNGKIVIDTIKKQADSVTAQQVEAEKEAIFSKMKISKQEYEKIKK